MNSKLTLKWSFAMNGLRVFIIILLVLGVFFRFVNLDRKTYWGDEAHTSILISGYTFEERAQQTRNGSLISIKELQKFQSPDPNKSAFASVIDTIKNLATQDNQHMPLYYSLVTLWLQWFGHSVAVTRSFSAFISVLAFPCLYWLCQELFESSLVGWIAMGLIAVSPAHVLYAQEARPYSLWIVAILLSSAALLRAMRLKTKISWLIYAATVSLGLYTHLLFGLVLIGHATYVAAIERFRLSKTLISYVLTSLAGFLTFVPWILIMITITPKFDAQSWQTATRATTLSVAIRWAGLVSRPFFDLGVGPSDPLKLQIPLIPFILILLTLIIYSIYFLCSQTPKRVWLFVLTLIGVAGLALMLPDLIFGQRRGTTRFIFPCILGIQISVAYLLTTQMTSISANNRRQKLWQFISVILISMEVISCAISSQAEMWWNKAPDKNGYNSQMASIVNEATQPLLISDAYEVYVFSYKLDPKVRLQLVGKGDIPEIPDGFSEVFLYKPSESLRFGLEKEYKSEVKPLYKFLWKLESARR
jgi:uncharacterized membrane protein